MLGEVDVGSLPRLVPGERPGTVAPGELFGEEVGAGERQRGAPPGKVRRAISSVADEYDAPTMPRRQVNLGCRGEVERGVCEGNVEQFRDPP